MTNLEDAGASTRRQFLKRAGIVTGASVASFSLGVALDDSRAEAVAPDARNDTVRMVQDLARALTRPIETRKWAMVIDPRRCVGCHACTVACYAQNASPKGVRYRTVVDLESGSFPKVERFFMPTNCMQCENAPCIDAANAVIPRSMRRRPDGIVTINYARMKGRRVYNAARKACPYKTALSFDRGRKWTAGTPAVQPYDRYRAHEYGRSWSRADTLGTTRKCHFCSGRIDAGHLPACVSTCTGQAMHFGDLNDSGSLVSELVASREMLQIQNNAGTSPRVLYVDDRLLEDAVLTCSSCHV